MAVFVNQMVTVDVAMGTMGQVVKKVYISFSAFVPLASKFITFSGFKFKR